MHYTRPTRGGPAHRRILAWRASFSLLTIGVVTVAACVRGPAPLATLTPAASSATGNAADSTLLPPTATTLVAGSSTAVPPTPLPTPTAGPVAMTVALPDTPGTLDPANANDRSALLITRHMYEGLLAYAPGETRVVPALADSWSASADGLTWTFQLKSGVRFSDSTPFDANAARLNFERWFHAAPAGSYLFWQTVFGGFAGEMGADGQPMSLLANVSAPSPQTLILTLTQPDAALPSLLAMPSFAMVSPAAFQTADAANGLNTVSAGTGPYVLDTGGQADLVRLKRNPAYWGLAATAATAPSAGPDELIFKIIPDDTQRLLALQTGEVQGMANLNPHDYAAASAQGANTRVVFDPALDVLYLGFNQAHAPWGNLDCRLAVAYALDKSSYVKSFFPGDADVALAMQPPGVWGYSAGASDHAHDPTASQQHWQACLSAGVTVPVSTTLYIPPVQRPYLPDPAGLGAAIKADLSGLTLTVVIQSPDWQTAWLPAVQSGQADLFLLGWSGISGDPDSFLCPLFCGSDNAFNTGPNGKPAAPDQGLATLLQEAHTTPDPAARQALYAQAHARIFDTVPAIPLAYRKSAWAFRSNVQGYTPSPIDSVLFDLHYVP